TQTPSGAGYALENRLIISRTFPSMYRDSRVERLAGFFADLRDRLEALAPRLNRKPRIVILTPGPENESYFEHAYLARYLGFQLVQANDLTARENRIYLKTLGGLKQVDVIVRRQDDLACDPLAFGSDQGIPGLVEAAAAGEVVVANALGSALAETPALLPFLPMLSRHLLGEEPLLQSIPTLWLGQSAEMNQVLNELDRWVIKYAFPGRRERVVFPGMLSESDRGKLIQRIKENPGRFIAQENTALSVAPCWRKGILQPRHIILRTFVTATRSGWKVMPGGLVRTSATSDSTVMAMEKGGGSKDAWVLARNEISRITLLPKEGSELKPERVDETLPSRVADNLFWLGRYIQRAELQCRMLRTIMRRLTEETMPDGTPELAELIRTLAVMTEQRPSDEVLEAPIRNMEATIQYVCDVIYTKEYPSNLYQALNQACRIGTMVRDRISIETWRILDRLDHQLHHSSLDIPSTLDELLMILSAFSGLGYESMTHGYGWHFMDMGFRMERAGMNAIILRELLCIPAAYEEPVLDAILETTGSAITYRTRYQTRAALLPLLDLLLQEKSNPRGIAFQLELIHEHIRALSNLPRDGQIAEQVLATDLLRSVEQFDLMKAAAMNKEGCRHHLMNLFNEIINRTHELGTFLTERYLAHVESRQQLFTLVGSNASEPETDR
ncbi:MAG: circularly permuted type 2 ATP-grasp protein, partial [Pontiellaceae bacterium]|nr:circularly permuted type 2 ATP-grasp protein [Pontiellaceae bacterium]